MEQAGLVVDRGVLREADLRLTESVTVVLMWTYSGGSIASWNPEGSGPVVLEMTVV